MKMKKTNVYDLSSIAATMRTMPAKKVELNRSNSIWSCGGKNSSVDGKVYKKVLQKMCGK
jgi:hypothetical protein